MINLKRLNLYARIYVAAALVAAAVLSPLALSFVPVILLLWYLYQLRWPLSAMIQLLTQYFTFFAIAILFSNYIAPFLAPLVSLPLLITISNSLEDIAPRMNYRLSSRKRSPTRLAITCLSLALAALFISIVLDSLALILASSIIILYFIGLGIFIVRNFPIRPVEEEPVEQRILAGNEERLTLRLKLRTIIGGLMFIESDEDWIKVISQVLSLKGGAPVMEISLSPHLSGPGIVKLSGHAVDRWGIIQTNFEIEPVKVLVIPRASYAKWLAERYMSSTRPGSLPLLSSITALTSQRGLRQGIEYYGNRPYEPGDSLRTINWKQSAKLHELISKEFTEFGGQPVIMLVNLVTSSAEESDKLAYNIILAAISLGRENIPTALAVYNHEKVVLTTLALNAHELVLRSLQLINQLVIRNNPRKYLSSPDVLRLQANIRRLSQSDGQSAKVLEEMLKMEYQNLSDNAKVNPSTLALSKATSRTSQNSTIVVLSQRNHDAEALAYTSAVLFRRGKAIISI